MRDSGEHYVYFRQVGVSLVGENCEIDKFRAINLRTCGGSIQGGACCCKTTDKRTVRYTAECDLGGAISRRLALSHRRHDETRA